MGDPVLDEALARVRALLDQDPPRSRWAQLATVDEAGAARVRTLVLHGLDDDAIVAFATDSASGKARDLRARPRAEVCLLSREKLEQARLLARFDVVDAARSERDQGLGARRRELWKLLAPGEKGYYVSPPPGLELSAFDKDAFKAESHEPEPVPRFAVLLGAVERIDVLDVSVTPHRRVAFERGRGGAWTKRSLTP
jgi:hypothetical protein